MIEARTLPEYLKRLRKACRYKQDFVASRLHITRQTYSHYETGRVRPPAGRLYTLAKLYGVSVEGMLSYMEPGRIMEPGETEKESLKPQEMIREPEDDWKGEIADCSSETLLYYFERLDRKDKIEILSLMKIKERMNGN